MESTLMIISNSITNGVNCTRRIFD